MDLAIDSCIKNDILAEFLSRNRVEVLRTSIFEYDQEKHIKQENEESWERRTGSRNCSRNHSRSYGENPKNLKNTGGT